MSLFVEGADVYYLGGGMPTVWRRRRVLRVHKTGRFTLSGDGQGKAQWTPNRSDPHKARRSGTDYGGYDVLAITPETTAHTDAYNARVWRKHRRKQALHDLEEWIRAWRHHLDSLDDDHAARLEAFAEWTKTVTRK